jgi:hypothetical protein
MPGAWLEGMAWCDCVFLRGGRTNCVEGLSGNRSRGGDREPKLRFEGCCVQVLPPRRSAASSSSPCLPTKPKPRWHTLAPRNRSRLGRSAPGAEARVPSSSWPKPVGLAFTLGPKSAGCLLRWNRSSSGLRPRSGRSPAGSASLKAEAHPEWKPIRAEARQVTHLDAEASRRGRPVEAETPPVE